jgi:hypothetical protein
MEFKKAVKAKQKLRLAIDGVSGSGKTYTALAIATGMGGRVAVIDTEHGSASLYAGRFEFDSLELSSFQIEDYIEAMKAAEKEEYEVLIIDSTSHAWDALLERVERIADRSYNGNSFRAWAEGTPLQRKLIEAMLDYPGHVIVTCRSKSEYAVTKDGDKTKVKKMGTAAVQRQGFEYEFTMTITMNDTHTGFVTKDRTGKFQDKFIEKPDAEFGRMLVGWLNEGETDYKMLCRIKQTEIGNILKSEINGVPLFTEAETDGAREKLRGLLTLSDEERLPRIERILEEQKSKLVARAGALNTEGTGRKAVLPAPEEETTVPRPALRGKGPAPDIPFCFNTESEAGAKKIKDAKELEIF